MKYNLLRWTTPILLLYFLPPGYAIFCYKCVSTYDGDCVDPVKNNVQLVDCDIYIPRADYCKKMISYGGDQIRVIRDCVIQSEKEEGENCFRTNQGDDYCRCKTDACNSALDGRPPYLFFFISLLMLFKNL